MDVSVVVCTYDRANSLGRTLTALLGQRTTPGLTWELVLVDNNSSDDTRAVVSAAATTFPVALHSVFETLVRFNPQLGAVGTKKYSLEEILFVKQAVEVGKVVMFDPTPTVHHWVGPERMCKSFYRSHAFYYGEGAAFRNGPPKGR